MFNHRPSDDEDVFRRLAAFHVGKKADKYNPVAAGKWNVEEVRRTFVATLDQDLALYDRFRSVVDHRTEKMVFWA